MQVLVSHKILFISVVGIILLLFFGKASAGIFGKKTDRSGSLADSDPLPQLPYLENSKANDYDVLRISGYPGGSIRFIPSNKTFVIPTSLRFGAWINLWRVNADGILVDSFTPDGEYEGNLPGSGIFFRKDNYIDWAFTGDKTPKLYNKILDAQQLGNQKIHTLLGQAKQIVWTRKVYYEQIYRGSKETPEFHYFLKSAEGWALLISATELTLAEYPELKLALGDGQLADYQGPDLGVNIINATGFDVKDPASPIQLLSFKKIGESKSGFMDINSSAWVGDYGFGHFQLREDSELIQFKSFHRILKRSGSEGRNEPDMAFYNAAEITKNNNELRFLILETGRAPTRGDDELGSYIIRKKITPAMESALSGRESEYVKNSQAKTPLSISIKGFETVQSNLYWMTYFNGASESFRKPNTWEISAASRGVPMELRGSFELPIKPEPKSQEGKEDNERKKEKNQQKNNNRYYSYAVKINDHYFKWSDVKDIHYALHFDYDEMTKIYSELSSANQPLRLSLNIEFVNNGAEISAFLSNTATSIAIKKIRFASVACQEMFKEDLLFIFDQKMINALNVIKALYKPYGLEGPPAEKIPAALTLMRQVVNESEYPERLDYAVKDASWFLLNGAISAKDAQLKLDVVNNYVVNLFPKIGVSAGLVDFVRRAVDLGVTEPNEELVGNISYAFFNPKTIINYDKDQWLLENGMLDQSFKVAMFNSSYTDDYIWLSTKVLANNMAIERLSPAIANHYTKLIIKALTEKKYETATKLSTTFMDNLYPKTGYSEKSTDVISNIIVTGSVTKNEKLLDQVMSQFVNNPTYKKDNNKILYFNIACYYATHGDKINLLKAAKISIESGYDAASFLSDDDFKSFKDDPDFIAVVNASSVVDKK